MEMFGPDWWHHHGTKIKVTLVDLENTKIVMAGSAAELSITFDNQFKTHPWIIEWKVVFSLNSSVAGKIYMSTAQLGLAFDCPLHGGYVPKFGQWLIDRYSAQYAEQGKFIRDGNYLNIPCPGTGHDGDPNISIDLDSRISEAVELLIDGSSQ